MEAAALGLRVDGVEGIDRATSSLDRLTDSAQKTERASDQLAGRTRASSRSIAEVSRESERASRSMAAMSSAAVRLGGALAAAFSVRQLTRYADTWTNMTSQVELSIGAHEDASAVMGQLADISRQTYSTMESTTEAFARNSFTLRALGKSTQDQINFTAALNNALAVSGAEGERALMVQNSLSRAMAEGTLRGEDLNNVLNSGSRVAELLADSLGINVTQLRAVAADGRITSAVIYDSLVGAMEELSAESMGMGSTVRGGMRVLSNAVMESVGALNQMYDVSGSVSRQIVRLADAVRDVDWEAYARGLEAVAKAAVLVVGARLAAAVAASNAALAAKAAAASTATIAVNALAGASGRQAAAASAMAAANRAAAGALALIGGPVGAAVIAAGALYLFREELNGTAAQSRRTAERVDDLTNAINTNSEAAVRAQLVNLTAQMFDLERQAIAAREALDALSQDSSGGSGVLGISPGRTGEQARAIQELGRIAEEMDAVGQSSDRLRGILEALRTEGTAPLVDSTRGASDAITEATKSVERAADATDELARNYQSLRDRLRPLEASQRRYAQEKATLVAWALRENKATSELQGLLRDLELDYRNAGDAAEEYGFTGKQALEDNAYDFRTWEEVATSTISRVDNAGQDLWLGFIDGSRNALDTVKRFFQQTLAEIAHMLTTQRLTVAVAGSLGLGGSGSAMGGMGGGMDFTNLGQAAYKGYNWLIGGGTAAAGQAGTAAIGYGGTGWASQVGTGTYGGWAGNASAAASTSVGAAGGLPSWAGGAGQVGGLASGAYTAGAGFAGGWLGNQVFGGGGESNTGAAVGTAIGAYVGSIVPVIGTYLGSAIGSFLGSGLGSLFGSERSTPKATFESVGEPGWSLWGDRESAITGHTFGASDFHGYRVGKEQDALRAIYDAVIDFDAAMASVSTPEQLDLMREALDGYSVSISGLNGMSKLLTDRVSVLGHALETEFLGVILDMPEELRAQTLVQMTALTNELDSRVEAVAGSVRGHLQQAADGAEDFGSALTGVINTLNFMDVVAAAAQRLNLQFDATNELSIHAAHALHELAGGLEGLNSITQGYYQAVYSESERVSRAQVDLLGTLRSLSDEVPTTVVELRELVEAQNLNTEAGAELALQLMSLAPAFADVTRSVEQALAGMYQTSLGREADAAGLAYWMDQVATGALTLEDALWHIRNSSEAAEYAARGAADAIEEIDYARPIRDAFSTLRRLVNVEQRAMQEAHRDTLRGIDESIRTAEQGIRGLEQTAHTLRDTLRSMTTGTLADQQFQRQQAQAQITTSLALARMAGTVDMTRGLEHALQVVSEPSEGLFSTLEDYRRDFYRTAHDIESLADLAEDQMTTEERSLRELQRTRERMELSHRAEMGQLDSLLSNAEQQVNALLGIDDAVRTIPEAIAALEAAMGRRPGPSTGSSGSSGGGSSGSSGGGSSGGIRDDLHPGLDAVERTIRDAYSTILQSSISAADIDYWSSVGLERGELAKAIAHVAMLDGNQHATSWWERYGHLDEIPGFAAGGIASGPMSGYPVELHGTEAVIPLNGGSIPLNVPGIQALVREVSELRRELAASQRAIAENSGKAARVLEREEMERRQEEFV